MGVNGWVEALATECRKHWDRTGKVFLLSGVPGVLRVAGYQHDNILQGRKLKDVLIQEGAGAGKLVQNEADPLMWGLAPTDATLEPPYSEYFPPRLERPATSLPDIRFKPAFWKAFAAPLEEGSRRYLLSSPWPRFQDLPEGVEAPDGSVEIEREYTANASLGSSLQEAKPTLTRVWEWLKEHGASPTEYAIGKRAQVPGAQKFRDATRAEESALHELIAMLTPSELHRVSLPLDIISRLLNTKAHRRQ